MLRTSLLLSLVAFQALLGCTPPYDTWWDGYCFNPVSGRGTISWKEAAAKCENDNAKLASIHSSQQNADFQSFSDGGPYEVKRGWWIGLRCDGAAKKFYWEDGSSVDYTNFADTTLKCNSTTADFRFYVNYTSGKWYNDVDWDWYGRAWVCKKNYRPEDSICEEYELVPTTKTCVSVYNTSKTTTDAESSCSYTGGHLASIHDDTVNDYIRRSAISRNLVNGVLIGLKQTGSNASALAWNDKTNVDYTNFAKEFPNNALGQCFAMQTSSLAGEWVNVNCGGTSGPATTIPYICSMPAYDFPEVSETVECPTTYYSDGDTIYSPMFPLSNNKHSCEYLIDGPAGAKNVQVEVIFFETNKCCDTLQIYEGIAGDKKIATLAGSTYNGKVFKSTQGPGMRLVYNVQSGAHVRGWQIKVKAIY